jgi:hypothetical protein
VDPPSRPAWSQARCPCELLASPRVPLSAEAAAASSALTCGEFMRSDFNLLNFQGIAES